MSSHAHSMHEAEHSAHDVHGGPKLYGLILAALLVFTVITVAVSYFPTQSQFANIMIAMGIATVKASLVGLFFMHLRWDKPLNAVIFVSGVFFLGILLTYTLVDSFSRVVLYPSQTTDVLNAPPPAAQGQAESGAAAPEQSEQMTPPSAGADTENVQPPASSERQH